MENNKKKFIRNPKGLNQWNLRSVNEIKKIINSKPEYWKKKDFRGEGKNNSKKILSKTETEREGLIFKYSGKAKQTLKEVYKYSTQESIDQFENNLISEEIFRDRARVKKQRDLMPLKEKQIKNRERYLTLTKKQKESKRISNKNYKKKLVKI